ncbi:MAG: hypothetical protein DBX55_04250 [Verrucomicrobia bacterium]|nr:MAG: hypothetical protein DBX55_04250 [Verrucomicrobiota bacterium]
MRKKKTGDGYEICEWKVGPSTFEANVEWGARLMKWDLALAGGRRRSVLYWDERAPNGGGGEAFSEARGGNPILFPFAGRSFVGEREGVWITPEGDERPMHLHGYASMERFEAVSVGERGFRARYLPSVESKRAYPYDFDFYVEYLFEDFALTCRLELENKSGRRIPWGAGTHFYFALPWHEGCGRANYRLVHDARQASRNSKEGVILPGRLDADGFDDPDIRNRVLSKLKTGVVKFGLKNGEEDVTVSIDGGGRPAPGTCVVTWTEFPDSPYYCVEPWMSPPKSSSKPVRFVEPGGRGEFSVRVSIE